MSESKISQISLPSVCGGVFSQPSGTIQSPNYPEPYPHNKRCFYLLSQPVGNVIALQFLDFQVEVHHRCVWDYVEVSSY